MRNSTNLTQLPSGNYVFSEIKWIGLMLSLFLLLMINYNPTYAQCNVTVTVEKLSNFNGADVSCFGSDDGSIKAIPVGGATLNYQYAWSANNGEPLPGNSQVWYNLSAGSYSVTVTDILGCTAVGSVALTNPVDLTIDSWLATDVTCPLTADGSITSVSVSGGTQDNGNTYYYTFIKETGDPDFIYPNPNNNNFLTSLSGGSYYLYVSDANNCSKNVTISIAEDAPMTLSQSFTLTNPTCFGYANGSIIGGVVTGGAGGYSYEWFKNGSSTGVTSINLENIGVGSYTLVVTDSENCSVDFDYTITEPAAIIANVALVDGISCNGADDGALTVNITPAGPSYSTIWTGPNGFSSNLASISGLAPGAYTVAVQGPGPNNCPATGSVSGNPSLPIDWTYVNTGTNHTFYLASANYGTIGGTQSISAGDYLGAFAGSLCVGYAVVGSDNTVLVAWADDATTGPKDGFYSSDLVTFRIFRPFVDEFVTEAFGFMNTPGTITDGTFEAEGVSILSSLSFSDVYPTSNIAYNLIEPAVLAGSAITTNITCNNSNNGIIDLSVTGGTTPYTYLWSNTATTQDLSGLEANIYSVVIKDANLCEVTVSNLTIVNPPALDFNGLSTVTNVGCFGDATGAISTVNVTGGTGAYTYLWSNSATTSSLSALIEGVYTVTVKDANLCEIVTSYTVQQPAAALAVSEQITNVACNGALTGGINITVSNGTSPYTYSWSNLSIDEDLIGIGSGSYTVTVTDFNGCTVTQSYSVTQPAALTISNVVLSNYNNYNVSCENGTDGEIEVFAAGGTGAYSYLWSNNATTAEITGLSPNISYQITITDANGCTVTSQYDLTDPDALSILPLISHVNCNGASTGAINLTLSGGIDLSYVYLWSNNSTTEDISSLTAGTYDVTVNDGNGCTTMGSYTINQPSAIAISETISDFNGYEVQCDGGSNGEIDLSVTGGTTPYTYVWSNGSTTADVSGLVANSYTVTVSDAYNCTATESYVLESPLAMIVQVSPLPVSCNNGTDGVVNVTIQNAIGNISVGWNGGSANNLVNNTSYQITGLIAGTYDITVTDENTCSAGSAVAATPAGWMVLENTGFNHTMAVPVSGSFEIAPSVPVASGDYLGVFFQDGANEVCGGYIIWNGINNAFTIWGDDLTTNGLKEGFAEGESFTWKVFRPYAGEFDATVTYQVGAGISSSDGLFSDGAASAIATMNTNVQYGSINITTAVVVQPALLTASLNAELIQCNNGTTDITSLVSGGNGGYTYEWSLNAATTSGLSAVVAGTYTVTVTDSKSCETIESITINNPSTISIIVNTTDALCYGDNTGTASLNVSGGYTGTSYTESWGNGIVPANLYTGNYTVTITDDEGCTATQSYSIGQPDDLLIAETITNINCNNAATGIISVVVSGGTTAYDYSWSNGGITNEITTLSAGTYTLTVEDFNGCVEIESYTITQPTALTISNTTISNFNGYSVSCDGSTDGYVNITAGGGITPYSYLWSNGATTANATGLSAGDYDVTITDANGCQLTSSIFSLTEPAVLSATAAPTTLFNIVGGPFNTTCNGMDGAAEVTPAGGVGSFTYNWSTGATTSTISNLGGGSYTVTVEDANGCSVATSTVITTPGPTSVTATVISNYNGYEVSCFNGSNGQVQLSWNGGVGDFDVYWVNWANNWNLNIVANSITVNTFPAGSGYYAVVVDANGCAAQSNPVSLNSPTEITLPVIPAFPPTCHDGTDGYIDITTTIGGVSPFAASWFFTLPNPNYPIPLIGTPANSGLVVNGVYADATYYGQITDNNGCSKLISVATTNISEIVVSNVSVVNVDCFGSSTGSITADVIGGHSGYTFSTSEFGTYTPGGVTNLAAGIYDLWVADAQGCKVVTSNISVTQNSQIVPTSSITNVTCNGYINGAIEITTVGGIAPYSYQWDYNNITDDDLTNLPAGTYNLTITDDLNCSRSFSYVVTEPVALGLSGIVVDVNCNNGITGSIDVTVTGGTMPYNYTWSNGAITQDLTSLTFGDYTLTVVDENGCTIIDTYTVTQPTAFDYSTSSVVNVSCNATATGSINFEVSGGSAPYGNYEWNNLETTQDISGLTAGTYTVTFDDAHGCTGTASYTVAEPQVLAVVAVGTDITCNNYNDGTITLTITGGTTPYSHQWVDDNLASQDRIGLSANTYTVVITDDNGCIASDFVTISNPAPIVLSSLSSPVSCNAGTDGELEVSITSGGVAPFSYAWTGSNSITEIAANLVAGTTYAVTVTDDGGCFASITGLTVTEPTALTASVNVTPEICVNADNGTALVLPLGGNGNNTFEWSQGGTDQLVTDLSPGTYTVTVTDIKSCSVVVPFTIDAAVPIVLTISSTNATCDNAFTGSANVIATGGNGAYEYLWNNSATTAQNNLLGVANYSVIVTDGLGCTATASVSVSADFNFNYIGSVSNSVSCYEGTNGGLVVNFDSNQPEHYSFQWFDAGNNPVGMPITNQYTAELLNVAAGNYTLVAYAYPLVIGCSSEYTFTVNEPADLTLNAVITDALCYKASNGSIDLTVTGGTPVYTYQWIKGASYVTTNQDPTGLRAATYKVIVTDANGCSTEGQYIVEDPAILASSVVSSNISCFGSNDGSITLTVNGGTNPFTYEWTGNITTQNLSNLSDGVYTVTITDANGCTSTKPVTITEPALLQVTDIAQAIENCDEVRLDATVIGGTLPYSFTWADNLNYNPILSVNEYIELVGSGSRYLKVTDGNGCIAESTETVTLPAVLSITASQVGNNAAASTLVVGGTPTYIYSWSHGPSGAIFSQVAGLVNGSTYTVTVTDIYGCSASDDVTITVIQPVVGGETTNVDGTLESADLNGMIVNVYPNPSYSGNFTVQVDNVDLYNSDIKVVDALGRNVQVEFTKYNKQIEVKLPANVGIYYLQIVTENRAVVTKQLIISE
jgi:hypothetical protein